MRLLFSNAGRRTYLVEYAVDLSRRRLFDVEVFVCDTNEVTASMWVDPQVECFLTPRVSPDPELYAQTLLQECISRKIDVVIPLMDYELPVLARWKDRFAQAGTSVIVSSERVINLTLDKEQCHRYCRRVGIPVPRAWYGGCVTEGARPPLLLKPMKGSGGLGIVHLEDPDSIPPVVPKGMLLQERLNGPEYGMDVLNGLDGRFIHACAREKLEMRAGETDKAAVIYDDRLTRLGRLISLRFGHVGNMDVDLMCNRRGDIYAIDLNSRFGGGYPFTHAAGFNYLHALLAECEGQNYTFPERGQKIVGAKGIRLFINREDA